MSLVVAAAIAGGVISLFDAVPYIRDTVRGSTRPHRGTWLIWATLSWVALASSHADGARWSLVPLAAQALMTSVIVALSISRGEGGVSRSDRALLLVAAVGVAGWFAFTDPTLATIAVIVADVIGAAMMLPKAWRDPSSETPSTFVLSSVVGLCALVAVGNFNPALVIYPIYYAVVNGVIAGVLLYRRPLVARVTLVVETADEAA